MAEEGFEPTDPGRGRQPLVIAAAALVVLFMAGFVAWIVLGPGLNDGNGRGQPGTSTPTAIATPAASPTPVGETPTPSPTASPSPSPSAPPSPSPEPPAAPGEFGELPPGEIPSGNPASRRLALTYRLDMSLQQIPGTAPVYAIEPREWSLQQVTDLADSLGIAGEVVDQGSGSYRASGNGSLYVTENLVQFISGAAPSSGSLPGDDALVQAARSWLLDHGLVGADIGPGNVTARNEDAGRAWVSIKPIEPRNILSAIPSAAVTVGADGNVLEANVRWPASLRRADYDLRSANDLWSDASSGRGFLDVDPGQLSEGTGQFSGTATIRSVSLAYTTAGNDPSRQFLVPLVVFEGQAEVSGANTPIPVRIYVLAVSEQATPRG